MRRLIPSLHLKTILALSFIALLIAVFLPGRSVESTNTVLTLDLPASETPKASGSDENAVNGTPVTSGENWHPETVQEGDNLSLIFKRAGISATTLHHILEAARDNDLKRLDPGQVIELGYDQNNQLIGIRLRRDALTTVEILRAVGDRFESSIHRVEPTIKPIVKFATITKTNSSLYLSGQSIAMSDRLIMEMAALFQWDISFALDLREGDHFVVLYEGLYVDDSLIREGEILAAHFTNMGQSFDAYRYKDPSGKVGYFNQAGVSLKKAFIRDPVHFSYVSSSFNLNRMHPIHKRKMPHRGIDYAAARGTPVLAAGDGKVISATRNEASGKFIVLQHGEQYTTKYLHLSNFAKDIKRGASVKQGQIIGYVGSTGWATGPHLHYEFLVSGSHRNPRTVTLPDADPVARIYMDDFKRATEPLHTQLQMQLALIDTPISSKNPQGTR